MRPDLDLDGLRDTAIEATNAASRIVLDTFGSARDVVEKAPGDWVSAADMASERAVREVLLAAWPEFPVFGEEEGGERADVGWLVDPLDGTTNFLRGFPVVGVSVALVADGAPVVGVVSAPMLGDLYVATAGGGATCNGETIRVSSRAVEQAICATGFPFRKKNERLGEYFPVFERALLTFEDLRRAGAASLDLAWVAAAVFDGYFEQALGPWDVAAGALLVREAGGVVTDWSGDDTAWLTSGDIVAAPPVVHDRLLALIAES
ncbi:MAG: inositol monophosphatase [Acidimicrobiia bacterium]|nr:inositol monophosphatase [Acidimicrobiia bacterium]